MAAAVPSETPVLAPAAPLLLQPQAVAWLGRANLTLVALLWLAVRPLQLWLSMPSPDVRRYYDLSLLWLEGQIPYRQFTLEYPPGALPLFALPHLLADSWTQYANHFTYLMLAVDLGIVIALLQLPHLLARATATPLLQRRADGVLMACVHILLGLLLAQLAFERYDAICTLILLLWYGQVLRRRWWAADLALATLIWVKLIGIILLPIYLAYALLSRRTHGETALSRGQLLGLAGRRLASVGGMTLLLFLPFWWRAGSDLVGFFTYHTQRGLQFESLFASAILGLHQLGLTVAQTAYARQSMCTEVLHPAVALLGQLILPLAALGLALSTGLGIHRLWRSDDAATQEAALADSALALLLTFVLINKVFSPQYMLWLTPFLLLLLVRRQASSLQVALGLVAAWCITALFQRFYYMNLLYIEALPVLLLICRNLVLLAALLQLLGLPAWSATRPAGALMARLLRHPGWAALATFLAATWALLTNLSETTANDIFIQIRVGYDILASGAFPSVETYSATVAGRPFIAHEWLSSVFFALLDRSWAGAGLSLLTAACALTCFLLLWASFPAAQRAQPFYVPLLLLALYLTSFRVLARPHMFSLVAFACLVLALELWRRSGLLRHLLWLLPVQLLWVNLHGAALFGPALFAYLTGLVLLVTYVPGLAGTADAQLYTPRHAAQLGGMTALLALACTINPYGLQLIGFSLDLMGNAYVKSRVWEWTSPLRESNVHYYWMWTYAGMLIILWIGLLARWRSRPYLDLSLALLLTVLSLQANRFVADFALFAFPSTVRSLRAIGDWALLPERRLRQPWAELALIALLLANTLVYGHPHSYREHRPLLGWGYGGDMPYSEVDLLHKLNLRGTIFNEYSDGSLIIWRLSPQIRPVLDSRIDLYPLETVLEYDQAYTSVGAFERYLQRHRINLIMLYRSRMGAGMRQYLAMRPEWQMLSQSRERMLFRRREVRSPGRGEPVGGPPRPGPAYF